MTNSQRIFITGGASGLGHALALKFAKEGFSVCIGDINNERGEKALTEIKSLGVRAHYLHCDVTSETDFQAAADWLTQNWQGVDVLVNNAGVAAAGEIDRAPLKDWEWLFNINVFGVARGCKTFVPLFKKKKSGYIINVASAAGLIHVPTMSIYNAAKAAVVAISETLYFELKRHNIHVSVVCPTFFKTKLMETLRATDKTSEKNADHLINKGRVTAEQIADFVYKKYLIKSYYIVPNADGRTAWMAKRLLPFKFYAKLLFAQTQKIERAGSSKSPLF